MVLLIGDCSLNIGKCHNSYRFNKYIHIVFKHCYRDFKVFKAFARPKESRGRSRDVFFPFSDLSNMVQLMLCHIIDFLHVY